MAKLYAVNGESDRITKSISEAFAGNPQIGALERVYPVPKVGVRKIIKTKVVTAIEAVRAISFVASLIVVTRESTSLVR